jgi:hypothetical protein
MLDVFGVRHVEENLVAGAGFSPILLDELLALLFEQIHHVLGQRDGLEERAIVVLFVLEALAVAAMLVFLAAATGTECVAGQLLASHRPTLQKIGETLSMPFLTATQAIYTLVHKPNQASLEGTTSWTERNTAAESSPSVAA